MFKRALDLGILWQIPGGAPVPDQAALYGLLAFAANTNNYAENTTAITTAGTNTTLTPAQLLAGVTIFNSGWSGPATITLPSTAAIIAALGPNINAASGLYAEPISFLNNGTGQTGTVTAGDASTTITGNVAVATNTRRLYLLTVNSTTTITLQNIGTMNL